MSATVSFFRKGDDVSWFVECADVQHAAGVALTLLRGGEYTPMEIRSESSVVWSGDGRSREECAATLGEIAGEQFACVVFDSQLKWQNQ